MIKTEKNVNNGLQAQRMTHDNVIISTKINFTPRDCTSVTIH